MARHLTPAQLRFLFGPAGPFHSKPGIIEKAKEHGLTDGTGIVYVHDNGTRLTVLPKDSDALRSKLNADPTLQNIGKPSGFHPGEDEAWRERVPYRALHIVRRSNLHYRGHIDRANPRQGAIPAIVHGGEVAVEGAPAVLPLVAGATMAASEMSKASRLRDLNTQRVFLAHRRWLRQEQPKGMYGAEGDGVVVRGMSQGEVRAVESARHTYRGHKFLHYRFVDEGGRTVGGVGLTVNPRGTAYVGGFPEKRLWSVEHLGTSTMRAALRTAKRENPEIRQFAGIYSETRGARMLALNRLIAEQRIPGRSIKDRLKAQLMAAYLGMQPNRLAREAASILPVGEGAEKVSGKALRQSKLLLDFSPRRRLLPLIAKKLYRKIPAKPLVAAGLAAIGGAEAYRLRHREGPVLA